ncbi:hypothetical protein P3X46_026646 [Hevea brasiliensis]|uniref:VQ domain-containing protein n=1 Tax=Hevea brasiliensis TaxID=3981 RepID=A0ABQ9KYT0_HEVBR|nr:VQ motif-containing protein 1-like [Hevea brasiliensis]KAJ9153179.1 hypothetical protein P3X46_026646 [Hevea brasiliensis]
MLTTQPIQESSTVILSMASTSREQVKVVIIDTRYVVTDPLSFKSVVQNLTGKDSCISWVEESSFAGGKRKREADTNESSDVAVSGVAGVHAAAAAAAADWKLPKGLSFKDLDKMILELPPMEEWHQLWVQNNLL